MFIFNVNKLSFLAAGLLVLLVVGCALPASADRSAGMSDSQAVSICEPVTVRTGDEFEVRLAANASTGCSWQVTDLDWNVVELLSIDNAEGSSPDQSLGAGGEAVIRFRAQGPGYTTIRLVYGHAWELENATYLIKTLDITVR